MTLFSAIVNVLRHRSSTAPSQAQLRIFDCRTAASIVHTFPAALLVSPLSDTPLVVPTNSFVHYLPKWLILIEN